MAGLLDTFTISKRGLTVQQSNINTSSHNIANANTVGYSRQRSVIETTRPFGGLSKYDSCSVGQIGTGAQVTAIQRVRDLFLDYQVRNKTTEAGTLNSKYQYLYQTENILNDSSDAGIQNALNEFFNAFQEISKAPEKTSNKDVAISQASALADMINSKYNQLEQKKGDAEKLLKQNVLEINEILDSINGLNKQISGVCAVGMTPNDLMDKRDNFLDELSVKFGINIDRDIRETVNITATESGISVDEINKLVASNPNDKYLRFSYISDVKKTADGELELTYNKLGDDKNPVTIKITCDAGQEQNAIDNILKTRVVLSDNEGNITKTDGSAISSVEDLEGVLFNSSNGITSGEIAGNQSAQDTIQRTMDDLDKLAISLAYTVNSIQTGTLDGTNGLKYSDGSDAELIFITKDATSDEGINAKNISLNSAIKNDSNKLIGGENISDISGEKAGTRALAIANLANLRIDYSTFEIDGITRESFFNGGTATDGDTYTGTGIQFKDSAINQDLKADKDGSTMKDHYIKITSNLGIEVKSAKENLATVSSELESYEEQRLSVSGVSLDEEMADLITFQHAYQANAKIINTIDQLLDVVINGLKA